MNETAESRFSEVPVLSYQLFPESILKKRQKVNILWTGGFDSTFRMIQLSKINVDIQPYYLIDKRSSEKQELAAISQISKDITNHPDTRCSIAPLIKIHVSDIAPDIAITEAWQRLHKKTMLGIQYEWLARFSKSVPGLELCLEKGIKNRAFNCIVNLGMLKRLKQGKVRFYMLNKEESNADLFEVFGNYHLPYPLFDSTKLEMAEEYRRMGFEHIMKKTWFCHTPVKNEPCGTCNPCKSVVEEGLSFRLTPGGMKKYKAWKLFGEFKLYKFYIRFINKIINAWHNTKPEFASR